MALAPLAPSPAFAEGRGSDKVGTLSAAERDVPLRALPDVKMEAGALVTADGTSLWSRAADEERAMASITKIMTAVVAIENSQLDEKVKIPRDSVRVGESTSYLRAGEWLTMRELLEALLVKSGNDAAVAIALHVAGDEDEFVSMMNDKAAELGLARTRFANPHGLDEKAHHTTASDLAVLARYAMTKPVFREIVAEKTATITAGRHVEKVESTNLLIGNYRGANGIKTGWTNDAGYCLIGSAERDGIELYAVVLGTKNESDRFRQARELLDWGFAHYRVQRLASAGTVVGEAPVTDYLDVTVPAAVSVDSTVAVLDFDGEIVRTVKVAAVDAPVRVGDKIGVATFTQNGRAIATVPLIATKAVEKPNPLERVAIAFARLWQRVFGFGALSPAPLG